MIKPDLLGPVKVKCFCLTGIYASRGWDTDQETRQNKSRGPKSLLFVRSEIEELVLDDRTADRTAKLLLGRCQRCADAQRGQTLKGQLLRKCVCLGQLLWTKQIKERAANIVRSRLGHSIDDAARAAAEFRRVASSDNLKFANSFLWQRGGGVRTLTAADTAEERLVVIYAVDIDVRINTTLAGKRDLAA